MSNLPRENIKTAMHYSNCTSAFKVFRCVQIMLLLALSTVYSQQAVTNTAAKNNKNDSSTKILQSTTNIRENSSTKKKLTYEVLFEINKSNLSLAAKDKLNRIYNVYLNNTNDTMNIISEHKGDQLFKERSIAVTNYLIFKGVPSSHIRYIEFGKAPVRDGIELILK